MVFEPNLNWVNDSPPGFTAAEMIRIQQGLADVSNLVSTAPLTIDTDYATLELALAATPVGGVLEMRGVWSRATAFTVDKTCTVRGSHGGSITITSATSHGVIVTANNVTLDGLTLTGTDSTTAGVAMAVRAVGASVAAPIDGLTVKGCKITNWNKYGIYGEWLTNFTIDRNTIADISYSGISTLSGIEGKITRNKVTNLTQPGAFINSYGIAMTRNSAASIAAAPRSSDIVCSGNRIDGVTQWEGLDTHGGQRLTITNNKVYGCLFGIALVGCPDENGVEVYAPIGIICTGNTIDGQTSDGSRGPGISLVGAGSIVGAPVEYANAIIANNTIIDMGNEATLALSSGILLYITRGSIITNNTIIRPGLAGVIAYHTNNNLIVSNNIVEDTWTNAQSYGAGVFVRSTNNIITVSGTRITRGAKTATYVNTRGLTVASTTANVVVDAGGNGWADAGGIWGSVGVLKSSAYGVAPVVKAPAVASPTADVAALKTAVDALRVALTAYGITF